MAALWCGQNRFFILKSYLGHSKVTLLDIKLQGKVRAFNSNMPHIPTQLFIFYWSLFAFGKKSGREKDSHLYIYSLNLSSGKSSEAYIEFLENDDLKRALDFNKKYLGDRYVDVRIEIMPICNYTYMLTWLN